MAHKRGAGQADHAFITIYPGDEASYHSHGYFAKYDPTDPETDLKKKRIIPTIAKYDEFNSLHFSKQDRDNQIEAMAKFPGFKSYMVNPLGNRKVFDGMTESQCKCSKPKTN